MTLFLTSSPCVTGAPRAILTPANGFIDRLGKALPQWPRVLFVCVDPDDHEMTCQPRISFCGTSACGSLCRGITVLSWVSAQTP